MPAPLPSESGASPVAVPTALCHEQQACVLSNEKVCSSKSSSGTRGKPAREPLMWVPSRKPVRRRMALRCFRRSEPLKDVLGEGPTRDCPDANNLASCSRHLRCQRRQRIASESGWWLYEGVFIYADMQHYKWTQEGAHLLLLYDVRRHKVHVKEVAGLCRGERIRTAHHGDVYRHRGPLHFSSIP